MIFLFTSGLGIFWLFNSSVISWLRTGVAASRLRLLQVHCVGDRSRLRRSWHLHRVRPLVCPSTLFVQWLQQSVATLWNVRVVCRFVCNRYMVIQPPRGQDVEWGYAFDVHLNAFFPLLMILHFFQLPFLNGDTSATKIQPETLEFYKISCYIFQRLFLTTASSAVFWETRFGSWQSVTTFTSPFWATAVSQFFENFFPVRRILRHHKIPYRQIRKRFLYFKRCTCVCSTK